MSRMSSSCWRELRCPSFRRSRRWYGDSGRRCPGGRCAGWKSSIRRWCRAARPSNSRGVGVGRRSSASRAGASGSCWIWRTTGVIIVIQPRMTGGFWLVEPGRPDHVRLTFHLDKPRATVWYCDTRRLGKVCWFPDAQAAAGAFARSHGPDAPGDRPRRAGRAAGADATRDQADADGSEGPGGDRQHLRGRDAPSRRHPSRAARGDAHARARSTGCIARSARSWPPPSSWRARPSTPAIARSSAWRAGSSPRTPSTAAQDQPCRTCEGPIKKTKIAGLIGRPTYYCPVCQVRE